MAKICEICGNRPARYICQECGRSACEFCFVPERWLCIECYRKLAYHAPVPPITREIEINFPIKLFLIGFTIIFVGTLILMLSSLYASSTQGGFIWIFPLPPFFFGAGQEKSWSLIAISAIIIVFIAFSMLIVYQIFRKAF